MNTTELRENLGTCFYIGFEGLETNASIDKFIIENMIGGVTLFANNYDNPAQVAELINQLQNLYAAKKGLPMVIAVDHEGGRVQRFKKGFSKLPPARMIGKQDSPKLAYECAELMAKELKSVGINTVFAPVADINTNPKNPVIGDRAFGETEDCVSKMVSAYTRGLLTNGIQPVVKHFPGHGDTSQDSHFHLPKVKTDLETLLNRELKPFIKAFKSRCEMVMMAHIIVESVENKLPATLSEKIIQDLLRKQLRFKGIIFTDDMEMKAIADHFGEIDAPLKALEAGANVLLYHTQPVSERVFDGLMSRLSSPEGAKARSQLSYSAKLVNEFRKKQLMPYSPILIPEISKTLASKEHLEFAKSLEKLS